MSSGTANEEGEFGFQIAPMLDVVFVLLLFFMACAGQSVTEGFLKIAFPTPTPPGAIVPSLMVDIDGAWRRSAASGFSLPFSSFGNRAKWGLLAYGCGACDGRRAF